MEASDRPQQAQHLPTYRKIQNGNSRVHQGLSDSRGMGVVDRPARHLSSHPHPPKLKEVPKVLPQFTGVPVPLIHSGFYNDCKGSEADGPHKGSQTSPIARPQRPQYRNLYKPLKQRSVVRKGKKATYKCSRVEGGISGSEKVQGPVPKPNCVGCYRQLNSSNLHKQTRKNPLGGDVCSPVENHDLVPSLPDNSKSQAHSRLPQCDGRSSVQVEPSPVNRIVTAVAGVQTDLSKMVHSSCISICHSSEPQSSIVCIFSPRPTCLGHRCSEHKLVGSHCLCLSSHSSPSQGDPINQPMQLPHHCNSSRLARDALVLGLSAALNRDPTSVTSVNNTSQTVPQPSVSQQSLTSQPPHLVSRSGQLQKQGFSGSGKENCCPSKVINKDHLFGKWCRENSVNLSTPSVK